MSSIREILRVLFSGGMTYREIGSVIGISHNTVSRYDRLRIEKGVTLEQVEEMDDNSLDHCFNARPLSCDERRPLPDFEAWHMELKIRGVTLELLWQEYRTQYPSGYSYAHATRLYKQWARKLNLTMRQIHRPGEKLFVDYSGKRLPITQRETGEIFMAEVFVAVMGASSKTYVEASRSQQEQDWLQSNANALAYFGGVPAMIVPDNLKSAVIKNTKGLIKLNPRFVDFARHYRTVIIPARPKKPKDKAKVEAGVRIMQTWILAKLRHRVFFSLEEANVAIRALLEEFNAKPFKKIRGSRNALFEQLDRPALSALPPEAYEYADWKIGARVGLDYMVEYAGCFYMVPHNLVDQYVDIRVTATTVEVMFRNKRVASHVRLHNEGERAVNRDYMPASHQHYSDWSPTRLLAWAQSVGDATEKVFKHLLCTKSHPESGFRACVALVDEGKRYGLERLDAAAAVATQINSLTLSSIRSILRTGRDRLASPASIDEMPIAEPVVIPSHENIRGANYYH
jgi:transposase